MKTLILAAMLSLAAAASMGASAPPGAASRANPAFKEEEARLLTKRAAVIVDAMGKEEMMMRIHSADPAKVKGTLAVTMRDLYTGVVLAHPRGPKFTGSDNAGLDPATRFHPRDVIELAKSSGKGRVGDTWVERVGDVVLEAGIQD
ncbi:cache domain-containing protein [Massilia sp. TSP1-1-2]|uniref:cache domain-containing protein n=1 Tax=unclassified Massilia TaxID=2609279 RepID=UPI003CF3D477